MAENYLFFDTETSDIPKFKLPNSHPSQPWICQLAAVLTDSEGTHINIMSTLIRSDNLPMSPGAQKIHGISKDRADTLGITSTNAISTFLNYIDNSTAMIAHNIDFDIRLIDIMCARLGPPYKDLFTMLKLERPKICTMRSTTSLCKLPFPSGRSGYKWPKLEELYRYLFNKPLIGAHDAMADVIATIECFFELKRRGYIYE